MTIFEKEIRQFFDLLSYEGTQYKCWFSSGNFECLIDWLTRNNGQSSKKRIHPPLNIKISHEAVDYYEGSDASQQKEILERLKTIFESKHQADKKTWSISEEDLRK